MRVSKKKNKRCGRCLGLAMQFVSRLVRSMGLLLLCALPASAQQSAWEQRVRDQVDRHQLEAALDTVDQRLAEAPGDLEAHGWRGRLLAWKGSWAAAKVEYRRVLEQAPDDVDILIGLADLRLWQQQPEAALQELDRARSISPSDPEVMVRQGRALAILGRSGAARAEFRQSLSLDPGNQQAKAGLDGLRNETRHELRTGLDVDSFNYTDAAFAQALSLSSRWNKRWSTEFASTFYQRFGEDATKLSASAAFRVNSSDWLSLGGAVAQDRGIIARQELSYEYGHDFRLHNPWIRAVELFHHERWLWFEDAKVLTLTTSQLVYLPKDWTWSLAITAAHSNFPGIGREWQPSGSTRLGFPLCHRLNGSLSFAVGSENFALADQTGRFAARTFAVGFRYQFAANQDISGYVAAQDRSQGRSQNSFGFSYGLRF